MRKITLATLTGKNLRFETVNENNNGILTSTRTVPTSSSNPQMNHWDSNQIIIQDGKKILIYNVDGNIIQTKFIP